LEPPSGDSPASSKVEPFSPSSAEVGLIREIWQELRPWFVANPPLVWCGLGIVVFLTGWILATLPGMENPRVLCALGVGLFLSRSCSLALRGYGDGRFGRLRISCFFLLCMTVQWAAAAVLIPQSWDSIRILGIVFAAVIGAVLFLALLPAPIRKLVFLALLCVHFLGIACLSLPGIKDGFLSALLRAKFYNAIQKPMYLQSNYQFFSHLSNEYPLLWFRLDYQDDRQEWLRVPDAARVPSLVEFDRERSLANYLALDLMREQDTLDWSQRVLKRNQDAAALHPPLPPLPATIFDFETPMAFAFPGVAVRKTVASFIRHVALTKPRLANGASLKSIRLYLVFHRVMRPLEMIEGSMPDEPRFYLPYFIGDFSLKGELLDPEDGLIGFALPIFPTVGIDAEFPGASRRSEIDFFLLHSGLDLSKEKR
jgi:hypothetical protein